jgi:hypothetical protein
MTLRVLVFAEDVLGMTLARDLCDRLVVERGPDWLSDLWRAPSLRSSQRAFSGIDPAEPWTPWITAMELSQRRRVFAHGLGLRGYAFVAYKAARLAATLVPAPDVVVFAHDTDGDESQRAQMRQGIERARVGGMPFALAIAHQEAEAWVVAGFVTEHDAEEATLRALQAEHGFAPTAEPHRLTAKRRTDPHDAKRVCDALFPDGTRSPRAERCWLDAPLEDLERRGARTGLPEYLGDVKRAFWPLLGCGKP